MLRACLLLAASLASAAPAAADTLVAAQTLRARSLVGPGDLALVPGDLPGALSDPAQAIGLEARVTLYAGRPIRPGDLGPPALIERNQVVQILYRAGGLRIATEGRALGRAGPGEALRVMNLSSRSTVTGQVAPDGRVIVQGSRP